eukprot:9313567-Alexandrium_andersonii.AAC.1
MGVRQDAKLRALVLPSQLPESSRLRLVDILAPRVAGESADRLPPETAQRARTNVILAAAHLEPDHAEEWAVAET